MDGLAAVLFVLACCFFLREVAHYCLRHEVSEMRASIHDIMEAHLVQIRFLDLSARERETDTLREMRGRVHSLEVQLRYFQQP